MLPDSLDSSTTLKLLLIFCFRLYGNKGVEMAFLWFTKQPSELWTHSAHGSTIYTLYLTLFLSPKRGHLLVSYHKLYHSSLLIWYTDIFLCYFFKELLSGLLSREVILLPKQRENQWVRGKLSSD